MRGRPGRLRQPAHPRTEPGPTTGSAFLNGSQARPIDAGRRSCFNERNPAWPGSPRAPPSFLCAPHRYTGRAPAPVTWSAGTHLRLVSSMNLDLDRPVAGGATEPPVSAPTERERPRRRVPAWLAWSVCALSAALFAISLILPFTSELDLAPRQSRGQPARHADPSGLRRRRGAHRLAPPGKSDRLDFLRRRAA